VTIPGAYYMVGANFCPKESPAGLAEMVDVMRLCEQQAYKRESTCCTDSSLEVGKSMEKVLNSPYVLGANKPWGDKQKQFTTEDFLMDENKKITSKLSPKAKETASNLIWSNPKRHGWHTRYPMTAFKMRQETDTLKDF